MNLVAATAMTTEPFGPLRFSFIKMKQTNKQTTTHGISQGCIWSDIGRDELLRDKRCVAQTVELFMTLTARDPLIASQGEICVAYKKYL